MRLSISNSIQAREETRFSIDLQHALAVVLEVVVPAEQVLGEGVEVERVAVVADLAEVLELGGKARLPRAVVGVEQDELPAILSVAIHLIPQVLGEGRQVSEGGLVHASASAADGNSCCISPFLCFRSAASFSDWAAIRASNDDEAISDAPLFVAIRATQRDAREIVEI